MDDLGNQIEYALEWSIPFPIEDFLRNGCRAMSAIGLERCVVSLVLTNDASIRKLNAKWRGKDVATDVLSFPMYLPHEVPHSDAIIGDIVVSTETAQRQADVRKHALQKEVGILFVHGLCHLMGYAHDTNADAARMARLENKLVCVMNESLDGAETGLVQAAMDATDV